MNQFLNYFKTLDVFDNILWQIKNNTFSHSHLIVCEDELSGKLFSSLVAMTLLCENKKACEVCQNCLLVNNSSHPDLLVYPKGKTFLVADSTDIIENAYKKPMIASCKVFLLNNFDFANQASQNKILKILEEPPKNVFFVLNAKSLSLILPTIISRMQVVNVKPFEVDKLKSILEKNGYNPKDEAIDFAEGWLGKAIEMSTSEEFLKSNKYVLDVLTNLKTSKDLILYSVSLAEKESFVLKLEIFERVFRNLLVLKSGKERLVNSSEKQKLIDLSKEYTLEAILKILEEILEAKMLFDNNVNLNLIADNLLLSLLEVKFYAKQS